MCGIAGYVGLSTESGRHCLDRMVQCLRPRGPDSQGILQQDHVGLGHTRLSIIDLNTGQQPLWNEQNNIALAVNGEIYNYRELRRTLLGRGHIFRTTSDSEVILHLYEEKGTALFADLDGMFALALIDFNKNELILARDRLGKKPLHYCQIGNVFYFASEIKALLSIPEFERILNPQALRHFLTLQFVPDSMSIFNGIHKVQPAEFLVIREGHISEQARYWQLSVQEKNPPLPEIIRQIRSRFSDGVRKRLVADVPVGIFLSGGLDSTLITAFAAQASTGPLHTYSIGFEEKGFSELNKARMVANHFNTQHHEFTLTLQTLQTESSRILSQFDEPFADPSALPFHLLCRHAHETIKVVLSGDGGDELFAGYDRYRYDAWLRQLPFLTPALAKAISALVSPLRSKMDRPVNRDYLSGLHRLPQVLSLPESGSLARWSSYFSPTDALLLLNQDIRSTLSTINDSVSYLNRYYYQPLPGTTALNRSLYSDLCTYAPGDYLVKSDRMGMGTAMEVRAPFLDIALTEYLFSLSGSLKIERGLKGLLKLAFQSEIPVSVKHLPKQGFSVPVGKWMREGWLSNYRDLAAGADSMSRTCFNTAVIDKLIQEHQSQHRDHGKKLYALLALEIWWLRYFQGVR
ncbi:MAG: asparagine synthase (glutamine-hydrolyzing) [Elusimicrobia bacterium RIFOXYB2_FULL_49_7]|nr:MAG: asparagine synthase (glutamine-hydrolyzing) [Elusimicrobia bacterium RIFOXYB2_FULL_49_7]